MVADLNMNVEVVGVPTVREADGLALSSRNAYLSADDRARAAALPRALQEAKAAIEKGGDVAAALADARSALIAAGFDDPDYVERSEEHTSELQSLMRISYAVFCLNKKNKYILYII